jgi:hypothetical protein
MSADSRMTYEPRDTLKEVADGVWLVDGPIVHMAFPLERQTLWLPSAFCGFRRSRFVAPPRDTPVSVVVAPRDPAETLEILGPPNRLSL